MIVDRAVGPQEENRASLPIGIERAVKNPLGIAGEVEV